MVFSTISPSWYSGFQISTAVLTKTYLSFKPTWAHITCLFLCCVHFLSPLVISAHALIQNKVNWGPRHGSLSIFQNNCEALLSLLFIHFLPINENVWAKGIGQKELGVNKNISFLLLFVIHLCLMTRRCFICTCITGIHINVWYINDTQIIHA